MQKDIKTFLDQDEKKDLLRILTAGSVDDGKSTLIGRLLFDSKRLYEDQLSALERDSKRVGHAGDDIDYALLLDGLKAEREQGITIDVAYRYFSTNQRKFIIADTPGHEQYTRNMVTGASTANLAVLLVDARHGVITQTKRHTFIVNLLGIKHVVVAINKMDLVDYSKERFDEITSAYKEFITGLNIPDVNFIPISALKGDNVVNVSDNMPWYHGKSMLEFLETVHVASDRNFEDFRYPVQFVNKPGLDFRGFCSTVASGTVKPGDEIIALPSRKSSKIKQIIGADGEQKIAFPPQSITITLDDEIDVSRGDMLVHHDNKPRNERQFEAMLVWMDENKMNMQTQFYIKHAYNTTKARIDKIQHKINVNSLEKEQSAPFVLNEIGRVVLTTVKPLLFDPYKKNKETGSFVLIDPITHNTSAVGMIIDKLGNKDMPSRITDVDMKKIDRGEALISHKEREQRLNQRPATLWITGLHGSGKNALAYTMERKLFDLGASAVLMDGSTVRSGLSRELDHSPADRAEHLRRVAHVAKILNDQGLIVICSFISPYANIRQQVSEIVGKDRFHIIHMDAALESCRKSKPDLYNLADKGKLKYMPGLDERYEKPENPTLRLKPENKESNMDKILDYLNANKIFPLE
ncbi:MAG: sulfate adenylyltransferase subunit CysN [Candidatus Delongbacteria bacterium]|jgi:bifunctional enzyme CysN/CysC|nr:sulfate adenylyltransferase subunit CysN [Candidatus Delongbacteria bacterium]